VQKSGMKLGDLVRVSKSKSIWKLSDVGIFEGQVGVIIDVETTPRSWAVMRCLSS